MVDDYHSVLEKEYDLLGKMIKENGTPFVGYDIHENHSRDFSERW